ncbi:MAG TPA: hypothetical protein DEB06_01075 [Phycisphaerales bacterium]|nr:hypothetical protein [Phycisphaerales bacterium]
MNTPLDDRIRQALDRPADPLNPGADEASVFQLLGDTVRGRQRWVALFAGVVTFAFVAVSVLCAVRVYHAADTRGAILWAAGLNFSLLAVAMLKMWFWLQMDKYALLREIKRLELHIARLSPHPSAEK